MIVVRSQVNNLRRKHMYLKIFLVLMVLCFSSFALADTSNHRQAAEEVLLLMKVDEMMNPIINQIQQNQLRQLQQSNMSAETYEIAKKHTQRIFDLLLRELHWEKWKDDSINMYTSVYSEVELKELIEFYKSPLGRKMVEKTPFLTQQSLQMSQKIMKRVAPEIQAISNEMKNELNQKYPSVE